ALRDARHSRARWSSASLAVVGTFALAWFERSFLHLMPIAFAAGLADSGAGIPMSATIAEQLNDAVRGRANSVVDGLYELSTAIGSLAFAWLGEPGRLGPARAMAASAVTGSGLGGLVLLLGGAAAAARHGQRRLAARPDA